KHPAVRRLGTTGCIQSYAADMGNDRWREYSTRHESDHEPQAEARGRERGLIAVYLGCAAVFFLWYLSDQQIGISLLPYRFYKWLSSAVSFGSANAGSGMAVDP